MTFSGWLALNGFHPASCVCHRRWVPVEERGHMLQRPPRMAPPPEAQLQVVDYLVVPRYRR
jgi:hypothetical protein